jgi:hypothetical protein
MNHLCLKSGGKAHSMYLLTVFASQKGVRGIFHFGLLQFFDVENLKNFLRQKIAATHLVPLIARFFAKQKQCVNTSIYLENCL